MPLTVRNNSDLSRQLIFKGADSVPFDLSGSQLAMSVKKQANDIAAVLHFSSADGSIYVVNAAMGQVELRKPMAEIAHLEGEYVFDIVAVWPQGRRAIMADTMIFEQGVTR